MASPQLVGYASELPTPRTYCTKTVMGRSILMTRGADGTVKAFDNVCLHRQSQIVAGCGPRPPILLPLPRMDVRSRRQPRRRAGQGRIPREFLAVSAINRTAGRRARRIPLAGAGSEGLARRGRTSRAAGRRARFMGYRADGHRWARRCWTRRSTGSSRSTRSPRTTTSRPCTETHSRPSREATARCSTPFGPHHRLVFPLNGICDLERVPEEQWDPLQNMVVIYALFPNIVISATIANGELFRVYPPTSRAARSPCIRTRRRWTSPTNPWRRAPRRSSTTPTARSATRTIAWCRGCRPTSGQERADIWCSAATSRGCSTATQRGRRR